MHLWNRFWRWFKNFFNAHFLFLSPFVREEFEKETVRNRCEALVAAKNTIKINKFRRIKKSKMRRRRKPSFVSDISRVRLKRSNIISESQREAVLIRIQNSEVNFHKTFRYYDHVLLSLFYALPLFHYSTFYFFFELKKWRRDESVGKRFPLEEEEKISISSSIKYYV